MTNQNGEIVEVPIYFSSTADRIDETTDRKFMSSEEKQKLSNLPDEFIPYEHPDTPGNKHVPAGGSSGQILRWVSDGVAEWSDEIDTTYEPATEEKDGLMTKEHVKSLNDKANKSKTVHTVLSVSDWVGEGPVTITLSVEGVTDDNNVEVFVANNATDEEVEAWMTVAIMTGSQSTDTITLKGYGSKPDIDIPITLIIRAD